MPDRIRDIRTVLGATAVYLGLLAWALRLVTPEEGISLMWLPDGFLLGVLVLAPLRLWPALLLSITAASVGVEFLLTPRPLPMVLGLLSANLVESVGGAIVVRTLAGGRDALRRFRDLAWFLGACVVALPATSALLGAGVVTHFVPGTAFLDVYRTWAGSAGLGILFIAPLVIVGARRVRADGLRGLLRPRSLPAAWLSMVAVVALSSSVGRLVPGADLLLLVLGLPLLSWTAITTGLWGGLTVSAVLVVASVQLTALGIGPYSGLATSPALALVQLQSYLGAAVVVSLFTSLAVDMLRRTSRELEQSRETLQEVVHSLDAGVVVYSPIDGVVLHNPSATAILEGPVDALFRDPRSGGWSVMEDEEATAMGILQQVRATRGPVRNLLLSRADGAAAGPRRWVLVNGAPRFGPSGALERLTLALIDVTELRQAQDRLRQAATALESTSEGVLITDLEGTILSVNPAFTRISGFSREEAIGRNPRILQSERHGRDFYQAMWRSLQETGSWRGEIWNRRRDGDLVPELLNISVVRAPQGQPSGYVAVYTDLTAIKRTQERLDHLAQHDALTDLPNRLLLDARLDQAVRRAQQAGSTLVVALVDVDDFKLINEGRGHRAGDTVLKEVARRLRGQVRPADTVARVGGDEFVVLLEDLDSPEAAAGAASRINEAFHSPFQLDGRPLRLSISMGLSVFPSDATEPRVLLQQADAAAHRAKAEGRGGTAFYTEQLTVAADEQLRLSSALRGAIARDELRLVYQPQVDLRTGALVSLEALLRWHHPELGHVSPGRFIPIAERTGLIRDIGTWVLQQACRQAAAWRTAGLGFGHVSVNVAGAQLHTGDLIDVVRETLADTGLPARHLLLEVTEDFVMRDVDDSVAQLSALRDAGVAVSIDDFGTGYAALSYLTRLPLDELKIDKAFLEGIPGSPRAGAIAETIIALGRALGLRVVAEGVETADQAAFVRQRMCDVVQGWRYSRPLEVDAVDALLHAEHPPWADTDWPGL